MHLHTRKAGVLEAGDGLVLGDRFQRHLEALGLVFDGLLCLADGVKPELALFVVGGVGSVAVGAKSPPWDVFRRAVSTVVFARTEGASDVGAAATLDVFKNLASETLDRLAPGVVEFCAVWYPLKREVCIVLGLEQQKAASLAVVRKRKSAIGLGCSSLQEMDQVRITEVPVLT